MKYIGEDILNDGILEFNKNINSEDLNEKDNYWNSLLSRYNI